MHSRLETLRTIIDEARATHSEIVNQDTPETGAYIDEDEFGKLTQLHEDTSDFVMVLLTEFESAERLAQGPGPNAMVLPKLPRLEIPKFSGHYDDWENLRDYFKPLVHDDNSYSDTAKLSFLKQSMTDTAKAILAGVTPKRATHQVIWEALSKRFYNELQSLIDMPFLKEETAEGLRKFTDESQRIFRVLEIMSMPVKEWGVWIAFLLAARLDKVSKKAWETELSAKDLSTPLTDDEANPLQRFPTFVEFAEFLEKRSRTLCMLNLDKRNTRPSSSSEPQHGSKRSHHAAFPSDYRSKPSGCPFCSKNHLLSRCFEFKAIPTAYERREKARSMGVCFNCLGQHRFNDCTSDNSCSYCKRNKHFHSLLHYDSPNLQSQEANKNAKSSGGFSSKPNVKAHAARASSCRPASIILATAQITVVGPGGRSTRVRALLDQGSETTFVSDKIANLLKLPKTDTSISVTGVGESNVGTACFSTQFVLQSVVDPKFKLETGALIFQRLTSKLSARNDLDVDYSFFAGLELADPQFIIPESVGVILGADFYGQLLRAGLKRFDSSPLVAQNTALGWIVSGPTSSRRAASRSKSSVTAMHCATNSDLDESLRRFWEIEELSPPKTLLTLDEIMCEKLFNDTHTRDSNGRYIVRLPLRSEVSALAAETRTMASSSLSSTHRRFNRNPILKEDFQDFMAKYESLGHMERVPAEEIDDPFAYYLPLHAVVQTNSSSRKTRVVFDARRQTRENKYLNQFLLPGPPLQCEMPLIMLNWQRHRYAFTADIVKMFRQIRVGR